MNYAVVAIIALVIHFIINFDILFRKEKNEKVPAIKEYRAFLITLAIFFVIDAMWGFFDEFQVIEIARSISTSLFFVTMAVMLHAWTSYVVHYLAEKSLFDKVLNIVGWIFLVGQIAVVFGNGISPILFKYVEGEYTVGPARYAIFAAQVLMFLSTAIYTFIVSNKYTGLIRRRHIVVGVFGITMVVFIVLQFLLPFWPTYTIGCIIGVALIRAFVLAGEKSLYQRDIQESLTKVSAQKEEISSYKELAHTDSLTGVRNKHSYVEMEEQLDEMIRKDEIKEFAVAVFDLNNLKKINDRDGHDAGDKYIVASVDLVKKFFPLSEIYRFGGDEFVIILQGEEYNNRFRIIDGFNVAINQNLKDGGPIVATGISDFRYKKDNTLRAVFVRADENMYARKKLLKKSQPNEEKTEEEKEEFDSVSNSDLRTDFYELLSHNGPHSLVDFLNNSSCDEILEVDMNTNTYKECYHVEGKYFVPYVGTSFKDLYDFTYEYIVHPDDREAFLDLMSPEGFFAKLRSATIQNFRFGRFRYKLQDGDYRYVEQCIIAGEENGLAPGVFRLYVFDIHNIVVRKLGQVVSDDSNVISKERDKLTGLLIEKYFFQKAEAVMKDSPYDDWCLISLDIHRFKYFCQWYGRDAGDLLLARIGAAMSLRDKTLGGVSGYLGKDDFIILARLDMDQIEGFYEEVRQLITAHGIAYGFVPLLGVAMVNKNMPLVDAFDHATIATNSLKSDVSKRICVFTEEMQNVTERETALLSQLKDAFDKDEIVFYVQPQCRISTGKIVGGEVLARWIKEDGTIIPPGEFIPLLEKYGFITDLDRRIWEKACMWLRKWLDAGHTAVPLSLNISGVDIDSMDINQFFLDITAKYNIPHEYIKLEITESAYIETTDLIIDLVKTLRKNGFLVLLDDFGSGYSSLNMLSNLKVDVIKLDANFLHIEGADYEKGIHILESVVNMAKLIAIPTIVEGVETQQQKEFLENMGCRYVQGYFFYRPMPITQFEELLSNEDNIDKRGFVVKLNEQFRMREFLDKNVYSDSMLNNILGAVAIYAWHDKTHVDIIRYNQQFYESVGVPDFAEKLANIETVMPPEDHPVLLEALKQAMDDKLSGSQALLRFYRFDGTLSCYKIRFYYIGKKEGQQRFYGSADNVTDVVSMKEQMNLVKNYSTDNMIFVNRISGKWHYTVASNSIARIFDLDAAQLEEELNDGRFAQNRVTDTKALVDFMEACVEKADRKENFEQVVTVKDKDNNTHDILLRFVCVENEANNIEYIIFVSYVNK